MITIDIGSSEENQEEEKIHHDHSKLEYFLAMLLITKLSYFAIFYTINRNMKITTIKYKKGDHPIGAVITDLMFIEGLIIFVVSPLLLTNLQLIRSVTFHRLSRIGFGFVTFFEFLNYLFAILFYILISEGQYEDIIAYKFFGLLCLIFQISIFICSMNKILRFEKRDLTFLSRLCFAMSILLFSILVYAYTVSLMEDIISKNETKTLNFFS